MLRIDYTNMMGDVVKGGIAASDWQSAGDAFKRAHAGLGKRRDAGTAGTRNLRMPSAGRSKWPGARKQRHSRRSTAEHGCQWDTWSSP